MSGTDAPAHQSFDLLAKQMVEDVLAHLANGQKRALVISPPATGKTTAAARLAFNHFLLGNQNRPNEYRRVLYIGSNSIAVQKECERIATTIPIGRKDWDFAKDGTDAAVIGITWRQLIHADLDFSKFSIVIADDAHHAMSPIAKATLERVRVPIIGFSNSIRHIDDTATLERRGSNIVLKVGTSHLKDFFGEPVTTFRYSDLEELGIFLNVPIESIARSGPIRSQDDPRVQAIVKEFVELANKNGKCKTIIHTESIEEAEALKTFISKAIASDRSRQGLSTFRIGTYHSEMDESRRARIRDDFESNQLDILINCQPFDEGQVIKDLSLLVVAGKVRTPHVYERLIGRIFHSEVKERKVLDLYANPANFADRPGHSGKGLYEQSNEPEIENGEVTFSKIFFGSTDSDIETINTDSNSLSPLWTRESVATAISELHSHGIGSSSLVPTRTQIDMGAQRGLCPPSWLIFTEHDRPGFFSDSEDLAKEIGRLANQYDRSNLSKKTVIKMIREQWKKAPAPDGLFSKEWLDSKCDGVTLPFRLRTIVGNDTLFKNFEALRRSMQLKGKYFRESSPETALEQLKNLYKKRNGKPPIAKPGKKLTGPMIAQGSRERICPSLFNLFENGHGNRPIFPGGLNEVNRLLGFRIFEDMSKEEILDSLRNLDNEYWPDRRFPISQSEIKKADADGKIPFTTKHIIGEGKFWETKEDFDKDLGYLEPPSHYRSLRQQIRFGKLEPASR